MQQLTILNDKTDTMAFKPSGQAEEILSKNFGSFGPIAAFTIYALDASTDDQLVICQKTWRQLPLYQAYLRFKNFDPYNIGDNQDIAFALGALLDQNNAEQEITTFQSIITGEACTKDPAHLKLIIQRRALESLINAIRAAAEYSYFKGSAAQQKFWHSIFSQNGARYSDGLFSGSFSEDRPLVSPSAETLYAALN